jgi:hypothetical protein
VDQDRGNAVAATAASHYVVERQVIYGAALHEQHYWVVWAIWDRWVKTFLTPVFLSFEEAERHVAWLRAQEDGG